MKPAFDKIKSLYELVEISAEKFSDRIALSEYKNSKLITLTYLELMTSISKKANDLRNLGLKEGANIATTCHWIIVAFSEILKLHILTIWRGVAVIK